VFITVGRRALKSAFFFEPRAAVLDRCRQHLAHRAADAIYEIGLLKRSCAISISARMKTAIAKQRNNASIGYRFR